jgi:hypothetical protein
MSVWKCTAEKERDVSVEGRRMMSLQKCTVQKDRDVFVEVYSWEGEDVCVKIYS